MPPWPRSFQGERPARCVVLCACKTKLENEVSLEDGSMSFSENLERLDLVLRRLETEALPLDEALAVFEEGIGLVRKSQKLLDKAEQKVRLLTQKGEEPFEAKENSAPCERVPQNLPLEESVEEIIN